MIDRPNRNYFIYKAFVGYLDPKGIDSDEFCRVILSSIPAASKSIPSGYIVYQEEILPILVAVREAYRRKSFDDPLGIYNELFEGGISRELVDFYQSVVSSVSSLYN